MKETAQDLRIHRTKSSIMDAFKEMMLEMDLKKISVKELTARAGIGRKTFYLHYNHIEDLINEFQISMLDAMINELKGPFIRKDGRSFLYCAFLFYAKQPELTYKLYASYDYRRILDDYLTKTKEPLALEIFVPGTKHPELAAAFMMNSLFSIICEWYSDGMKISTTELAEYGTSLIYDGVR